MSTLILSCNTGGGHNSCARAIQEAYAARGGGCDICDALQFVSDCFSRMVSRGHTTLYLHNPTLFSRGYGFFEQHPATGRSVSSVFSRGSEGLKRHIDAGDYDTVICTHPFAAAMLHPIRKGIRSAFVATDYTCSPTVKDYPLDFCFIPAEDLRADFSCAALDEECIVASGIPVARAFHDGVRRTGQRPLLVMMCGSMGCGPMEELLELLCANDFFDIRVVCGSNAALRRRLADRFPLPHVEVLGFVADMPRLLSEADVYLTKPGGLSSTEAAAAGVPMVFINAVGGCEEYNLRYFCDRGCALAGWTAEDTAALCLSLLRDPSLRADMSAALRALSIPNGAEQIFQTLCG